MPQPKMPNMQQMMAQVAAVNEALRAAQEVAATKLGGVTGGLDPGGMLGGLGLPPGL